MSTKSGSNSNSSIKIIDSNLHVCANKKETTPGGGFLYKQGQESPKVLQNLVSTTELFKIWILVVSMVH